MAQIKNKFRHPFAMFPYAVYQRGGEIGANGLVVYLALLRYSGDEGECFPGIRRLAREVGLCDRTIQRVLGTLCEAGLIEVTPRTIEGRTDSTTNLYTLLDIDGVVTHSHQGGDSQSPGVVTHSHQGGDSQSPHEQDTLELDTTELNTIKISRFQEFWDNWKTNKAVRGHKGNSEQLWVKIQHLHPSVRPSEQTLIDCARRYCAMRIANDQQTKAVEVFLNPKVREWEAWGEDAVISPATMTPEQDWSGVPMYGPNGEVRI